MSKSTRFNPRPPLLAGESGGAQRLKRAQHCFNPRPPLLAGESGRDGEMRCTYVVSIHARHCWRANRRSR